METESAYALGCKLLEKKNPNEAILYFNKALDENQNAYAYHGKGVCLCKMDQHEEAIKL